MNKFETVYNYSRSYCKAKFTEDGHLTATKINNDTTFQRRVYQNFQFELNYTLGIPPDGNAWVFYQNELKTIHNGKQTLKELCRTLYFNAKAQYGDEIA